MRKARVIVASLGVAAAVVLLNPAQALAAPPVGGCPSGGDWFLVSLGSVDPVEFGDRGNLHDQNGDGMVCAKSHKDGSWSVKDNTN